MSRIVPTLLGRSSYSIFPLLSGLREDWAYASMLSWGAFLEQEMCGRMAQSRNMLLLVGDEFLTQLVLNIKTTLVSRLSWLWSMFMSCSFWPIAQKQASWPMKETMFLGPDMNEKNCYRDRCPSLVRMDSDNAIRGMYALFPNKAVDSGKCYPWFFLLSMRSRIYGLKDMH